MKSFQRIYEESLTAYRGQDPKGSGYNDASFDYFKERPTQTGVSEYCVGKFFTSSKYNAESYGDKITKAELEFDDPMIVNAKGAEYWDIDYNGDEVNTDDLTIIAKEKDHDGLIVKNVRDNGDWNEGELADTIVALEPDTINKEEQLYEDMITAYRGLNHKNAEDNNFDYFNRPRKGANKNKTIGKFYSSSEKTAQSYGGRRVEKAEIEFDDPIIADAEEGGWDAIEYDDFYYTTDELALKAKKDGNDGVIVKNVFDVGSHGGGEMADTVIVIDPAAIKSEELKLYESIYRNATK